MRSVVEMIEELLAPFLKEQQLSLYNVEFTKENKDRFLRVYVDHEVNKSISIDELEKVSKYLSEALDREDPIKEQYYLEVSSPGAERFFRSDNDYKKFMGSKVKATLKTPIKGQSLVVGKLLGKDDEHVTIECKELDGEVKIPVENIKKIKNVLEF